LLTRLRVGFKIEILDVIAISIISKDSLNIVMILKLEMLVEKKLL
jgi:hypothetical protein